MFFPFKWVLSMTSAYCLQIYVSICSPIYMYIILYIIHYPPTQRHMASDFLFVIAAMFPPRIHLIFPSFLFLGVLFVLFLFFSSFFFLDSWRLHNPRLSKLSAMLPLQLLLAFKWICKRRMFSPNRNDKQCEWSRFEVQKSAGSTFLII